jgi:hypothetical protein
MGGIAMTRRSTLALVTLLVGLLSFASIGTVNADTPCTGIAREQCEQVVAQQSLSLQAASYTGVAREQYEAMQAGQFAVLPVSTRYLPTIAWEHYEQMEAALASN